MTIVAILVVASLYGHMTSAGLELCGRPRTWPTSCRSTANSLILV